MDEFTLTISLGNEAMQTPHDIAGALRRVAEKLERGDAASPCEEDSGRVMDLNGNRVGDWEVK